MSAKGTVVYLSDCAVDEKGLMDPFFRQELPWLLAHFQRVLMVSHAGVADLTAIEAGEFDRVRVEKPKGSWRAWLLGLLAPEFWREVCRMLQMRPWTPVSLGKLLLFTIRGQKLHLWLEKLLGSCDPRETTLYAYWMNYDAYGAALSKKKHADMRLLVRGHAFEIDPRRNLMNPYLMKRFIAEKADGLFFISEYAKKQYLSYMGAEPALEKIHVVGVGSQGEPISQPLPPPLFTDGKLRLVSCAGINPIKQIPMLIDALAAWDGVPLHWLHMGGGAEEEVARAYAKDRLEGKRGISYRITGQVSNFEVQKTYEKQAFDVFINTSRMEGVPVSIMEAMRFGIPVIAPRIGGIPELVEVTTGLLYAPENGAEGVLQALQVFAALPEEKVLEMRKNNQVRWEETCRLEKLLCKLFAEGTGPGHE